MREELRNQIKHCYLCQLSKTAPYKYGLLEGKLGTNCLCEDISTDIFGPFDPTKYNHPRKSKNLYVITFTDRCSRFTRIEFVSRITSKAVIKAFEKIWLKDLPAPKTILSDNGKCYIAKETKNYFLGKNIKQIFTSPYNPSGNGISERLNATISTILRIYKGWKTKIIKEIIEKRLNNIYLSSINATARDVLEKTATIENNKDHIESQQRKNLQKCNKRRLKASFKIGDKILVKNKIINKGDFLYEGPYTVKNIKQGCVQIEKGKRDNKRINLVNIRHIKPFFEGVACPDTDTTTKDVLDGNNSQIQIVPINSNIGESDSQNQLSQINIDKPANYRCSMNNNSTHRCSKNGTTNWSKSLNTRENSPIHTACSVSKKTHCREPTGNHPAKDTQYKMCAGAKRLPRSEPTPGE